MISTSSFKREYFRHGPHLALYHTQGGGQKYWETQWEPTSLDTLYKSAKEGDLGHFEKPFLEYLPLSGPILEAGCGTGRYVAALRARGYQVEGIDFAADTIRRILTVDPNMPVSAGDICSIDRPDNYYSAYVSIGVVEHNFAGPVTALAEAYRVLAHDGIALITVPYLNWPRQRLWQVVAEANTPELPNGLCFHQDHMNIAVFSEHLTKAGFKIIKRYPYLLYGGLIRDWHIGRWLEKQNFFSWRLKQVVKLACQKAPEFVRRDLSHMMMFVVRK